MGTTSTYFGGSGGGATAAPVISNNTRIKGLTYLGTTNIASHNSSNVNTPYITSMNDTHFVIFAKDSSSNGYVRLFSVDDTGTTTAVNNAWVQIGTGGSVNDMDGIGCGNGYRDCFIGYRNGSNNRILKLSWDGSSGISTNNALNRTGQGSPLNNAICFIDGTMAAQVYDQGGNIYWTHYSLSGDSGQSSSGFSGSPTSGFCGSVGMEDAIWSCTKQSTNNVYLNCLYRLNGTGNSVLSLGQTLLSHNLTQAYNPDRVKVGRAGNGVVITLRGSDTAAYGGYISGYATNSGNSGAIRFFEGGIYGDSNSSSNYVDQPSDKDRMDMYDYGHFCRQYNGIYTDGGQIVDWPEDTRFGASYPYRYISPRGYTSDSSQTPPKQTIIGNKLVNVYRIGTSGTYSYQVDVFTIN